MYRKILASADSACAPGRSRPGGSRGCSSKLRGSPRPIRTGAAAGGAFDADEPVKRSGGMRGAAIAFLFAALAAAGCTPQAALVASLLPDGTVPVLLAHLERLDDTNRRRIVSLEQRRDWEGLARFAEDNLGRDAHSAEWWLVAGYAYSQAGQRARAIECYAEAVRLAPDEILGWNLLAHAQRAHGQPLQAVRTLENALLVRRDSAVTHYLLGESLSDLGRDEAAVAAYREALALDRLLVPAWAGLERAYLRLERNAEAAQAREALERIRSAPAAGSPQR